MSGGGDVRVLRQEAGQESPRMPAWKREILERRKAKGGGGSGGAGVAEAGGAPQKLNGGEQTVNGGGGNGASTSAQSGGSGRNYTISTANQHFANNKETRPTVGERATHREDGGGQESLVLQESLGPLEDNPFIKLEKERRRRQDRENNARPVQHILEMYGSVPGIRTIRADNIIIIESDPDYFPEGEGAKSGSSWQQNGVSSYSSLNDLLDRRGSAVTEIRAKEVVIYDTTLSKSEENLSTLGRPSHDDASYQAGEGQGRVSRMLQKFDSNYGKLQKKSHSTENLLDLDCGASRPRLWPKPQPDLVPKARPGPSPSSPVFQGLRPSKPKPQPAAPEPGSPQRANGPQQSVSSVCQRFEESGGRGAARDEPDRGQSKPTRERDWEGAVVPPSPKVPCSPETRRTRAEPPASPVSSKVPRASADFEIRPSPKPDLAQIPDGDTQARALANLRLQSKNSFTVIPKRRPATSPAASPTASPTATGHSPIKSSPTHRAPESPTRGVPTAPTPTILIPSAPTPTKRNEEKEAVKATKPTKPETPPPGASLPTPPPSPSLSPIIPPTPSLPSVPASPAPSDCPPLSPAPSSPSKPPAEQLPVTNIDDIEVEQAQKVPAPSPMVQRRTGNTFTVVPKRRTEGEAEAQPAQQPASPEPAQQQPQPQQQSPQQPQGEAPSEVPAGSTPPQAPYSQLGSLLKKRYPAVEEIEVIGGYLSLAKSCLAKTSSSGKKLKISFNEANLSSTYEYPSENCAWDSGEEDEDGKVAAAAAEEQPSMVGRIHIPRPSFTTSPTHTNNGNDLSSYIPKHSVDFSAWQDYKQDGGGGVHQEEAAPQQTPVTEEVMLTPADSSSLSDYSSEPALYF